MTLNITVLSATAIYQSADFRLSLAGAPDPEPSTKRVILTNLEWSGFITYTGVGRVGTEHTSAVMRDWLSGSGDLSFDEVAEVIREKGTQWLAGIGPMRHTFVLAGYVGNSPHAAIISNYQRWHGKFQTSVASDMFVSMIVATDRAVVIVTGQPDSIRRDERRALQRLVDRHPGDSLRIREELARLQRVAATRRPALISEDCIVYSQTPDGRGHETHSGHSPVRDLGMMSGTDMTAMIEGFLDSEFGAGRWTMKQAAFSRSGPPSEPPSECVLEFEGSSDSTFVILRLDDGPGRRSNPRDGNGEGMIVGEGAVEWRGPDNPCMWPSLSEFRKLDDLGGISGQAFAVNERGTIAGALEIPDRSSHACIWDDASRVHDLHPGGGRSSGARALNDANVVVGWLAVHPTEHGQSHFRPGIWNLVQPFLVLEDMHGGWGEAIDVDQDSRVMGFVYHGRSSSAWIWADANLTFLDNPAAPCRTFLPSKLTSDGGVVGTQVNSDEGCHISRWSHEYGWQLTSLPDASDPTAFGRNGDSAGRRLSDGFYIPWLYTAGALVDLPRFRHHHHQITAMLPNGRLLGHAAADNCSHPLIWEPVQT